MRKYSIAMVAACPFPYPRGTPIRIFRMASALARRGHEVHVVTYHLGERCEGQPFQIHRTPGLRTYQKCTPGPSYQKLLVVDPLLGLKLAKVLRRYRIDLIHAHHYEGLLVSLPSRVRRRHPVIFDAHTLAQSELPSYRLGLLPSIKRWFGNFLDHRLPRCANHIISVSEDIRSRLIEDHGVAAEAISVVSSGVELDHFSVRPSPSGSVIPNGKTLIFTGNLAAYQGIDLLLRALKELLRRRSDVRLRIVSDCSFAPYESLALALEIRAQIDLVSSDMETLPEQLAQADVAVNPRTCCNGVPQKVLNYMAAGKPIVSFIGSAKHLEHEERGLLVEDGDVVGFADAADRLLSDPSFAMILGENARRYAHDMLSWERTAELTEAVYGLLFEYDRPSFRGTGRRRDISSQ